MRSLEMRLGGVISKLVYLAGHPRWHRVETLFTNKRSRRAARHEIGTASREQL